MSIRRVRPQSQRLVEWSAAVWRAAAATGVRFARREPVALAVVFRLPVQRGEIPGQRCTRAPDADKLQRALLDALQHAGMLSDDAQVAHVEAEKYIAAPGAAGVTVTAWRLGA